MVENLPPMMFLSEEDVMSVGLTRKDVIDILEDEFIAKMMLIS